MFITCTQSTFVLSVLLALPLVLLVQRLALLVLVRPAAVVLAENSRAEALGRCVFCTVAVPASPHFHVEKHKHTVG